MRIPWSLQKRYFTSYLQVLNFQTKSSASSIFIFYTLMWMGMTQAAKLLG